MITPPHGLQEIRQTFGDPRDFETERAWRRHILAPLELPAPLLAGNGRTELQTIWCHRLIVQPAGAVFKALHSAGHWDLLTTIGCYAARAKRGRQKLSTHYWGIALDLNHRTNRLGTAGDMPPEVVGTFEFFGWTWGGRWRRRDPMHFQFCSGY